MSLIVKCKFCSKRILDKPSKLKNRKFCSSSCSSKGRKKIIYTLERNRKIGLSKMGDKNHMWNGDNVGYNTLHEWIRRHKKKRILCECCNIQNSFDLANISGDYKRDINDFEWLCRSCHMKKDGRLEKLKVSQIKSKGVNN